MMKRISIKARLSKTYTYHCVRASCITRLSSSGVTDSVIICLHQDTSRSSHLQQNDREAGSHHCSCSGSRRREAEVHHCRCANGRWRSRRRGRAIGSGLGTARAAGWAGEAQREHYRRSPCLCNLWPCTCHELCRRLRSQDVLFIFLFQIRSKMFRDPFAAFNSFLFSLFSSKS